MSQAITLASVSGIATNIPELNGSNFFDWHDQVLITLGCLDLDLCLHIEPVQPTFESTKHERILYDNWKCSNQLSLMIVKSKIAKHIKKSIPNFDRARVFLALAKQQFQTLDKALVGTLMATLTTKKYNGVSSVREHIMELNNSVEQLKGMDMTIYESFSVQFMLNSLSPQFGPFKINYNMQKDKWNV
ncbi:uncharacterized protein [Coffea arabica]|uniref:Uncharacterized protein n=1 Tax=Coffea arabica TaxID=13443 RepID=A0ABM4UYH2_COFAR